MSATEPNTDPLTRRLLQAVMLLSLLLILVVVHSFLNGGEASLNPIAAAAEHTESQPGARFTMRVVYTSPDLPQPLLGRGEGARNSQTGLSRAVLRVSAAQAPAPIEVETIGDGTSVYMRGTAIGTGLPDGKEWIRIEPFLGHSESEAMLGGSDADSSLEMLSSAGEAEEIGTEQVGGVSTTRYRATIDLARYADALRAEGKDELADVYEKYAALNPEPTEVEAWVDGHRNLRRIRMVTQIPAEAGAPTLTMDMTMDLHHFGASPRIELPDPESVYDATPQLEQELDDAG